MDESIGNNLLEMVTGSSLTIDSNQIKWVTLNDPDSPMVFCEGTNFFSD